MNTLYFYIYLIITISATIAFTILRCIYDIKYLDVLFYPNPNNQITADTTYLLIHILVNFMLGFLFGFQIIIGMFVKIMLFDVYLYSMERCDVFNTSKISNLIIIVIISLISYTAGSLINKIYN